MKPTLVFDLETIPDAEVPGPEDPKEFPAPPCHQIAVIGAMDFDGHEPQWLGEIGPCFENRNKYWPTERRGLEAFVKLIESDRPRIVSWNGRGFDMPVIEMRAMKHGLSMPWWFSDRHTRYRYSVEQHLDLKDYLANNGAARASKLDLAAKLTGLPGKLGIDGSMVASMVREGRLEEVQRYCLCDVVQTAGVWLRVELLRGLLGRDAYRKAATRFVDFVAADARVREVVERMDRKRFLLES